MNMCGAGCLHYALACPSPCRPQFHLPSCCFLELDLNDASVVCDVQAHLTSRKTQVCNLKGVQVHSVPDVVLELLHGLKAWRGLI